MYILKKYLGEFVFWYELEKVFFLFFVVGIKKIVVNIEYLEGWKY